jgi:hypothetical protein
MRLQFVYPPFTGENTPIVRAERCNPLARNDFAGTTDDDGAPCAFGKPRKVRRGNNKALRVGELSGLVARLNNMTEH